MGKREKLLLIIFSALVAGINVAALIVDIISKQSYLEIASSVLFIVIMSLCTVHWINKYKEKDHR